MNVLFEVSTIAIGTAVLAAVIVAADWDLGVIRAWQSLTGPKVRRDDAPVWRTTSWEEPVWTPSPEVAAPLTIVGAPDRDRAEAWLAAAAAHQLADFNSDADPTRSVSLREALAARHRDGAAERAA